MPALRMAGGSGLCLLGHSPSGIFGECFTLGNRPGILRDRLLASQQRSHSSALEKKFSKVVLTAALRSAFSRNRFQGGCEMQTENGSFSSGASGSQGGVSGELITSLDSSGRKRFGPYPKIQYRFGGLTWGMNGRGTMSSDKREWAPDIKEVLLGDPSQRSTTSLQTTGLLSLSSQRLCLKLR